MGACGAVIEHDKQNSRDFNDVLLKDKDQQVVIASCARGRGLLSAIALLFRISSGSSSCCCYRELLWHSFTASSTER